MKNLTNFPLLGILFSFILISCNDNDVELYHPRPEPPQKRWLLQNVDYPTDKFGLMDKGNLAFEYNDNDSITLITIAARESYKVDKVGDDVMAYSRPGTSTYDSLLVKLDKNNRALHARHVIYNVNNTGGANTRSQNDSVHFYYNAEGYLIKMESYSKAGDTKPRYTEEYIIENGNVKTITNSYNHIYNYTYDDKENYPAARFLYEMPLNTHGLKRASCILVSNLVLISDYTGKGNKNNVKEISITINTETFANIKYDYKLDEDTGLVSEAKMSGIVNGNQLPEDYITSFSYLEKETATE